MAEITAGTARVDITPAGPIMMGGFGQRTTDSVGTHDPLFSKALFLSNSKEQFLWITSDLLSIPGSLCEDVLEGITQQTELEKRQILICASHTHSGPAVRGWHLVRTDAIRRYMENLTKTLIMAGVQAVENATPARLRTAVGHADFILNRRTRGNFATANPVDDRVFALSVEDPDTGSSKAVLFGVGCHPVCLGYENYLISADYPGYAQRYIESRFPAANALFFNMAQGNMIPSTRVPTNSMDPRGYNGRSFAAADEIGTRLSNEVIDILRDAPPVDGLKLFSARGTVKVKQNHYDLDPAEAKEKVKEKQKIIAEYLGQDYFAGVTPENLAPLKNLWSDACQQVIAESMGEDDMRRLLSSICHYRVYLMRVVDPAPEPLDVPIQVLSLNDFAFLGLPGEVLIEVGREWQKRTGSEEAFIVGLANDHFGYLPHSSNFAEPGAENKYETIMNALVPKAMDIAMDEACRMLSGSGMECG